MAKGLVPKEEMDTDTEEDYKPTPEETPTPEEQESYEAAINMAAEMIYVDDKANETIMSQLSEGDPAQAIASVTSFIIAQLEETFQGQLPEDIIMPVADETSNLLLDLAEEAGIIELTEETIMKTKGAVVQELIDDYGIEEADLEAMLVGVAPQDIEEMQSIFGGQ